MSKRKPGTQPELEQGMEPPKPPTPMPPVSDPDEADATAVATDATDATDATASQNVFTALRDRQHYYEQASKHERRTYYDQTAKELIEAVLILKEAVQARQLEARSLPTSVLANLEQRLKTVDARVADAAERIRVLEEIEGSLVKTMERGQTEHDAMRDRIEDLELHHERLKKDCQALEARTNDRLVAIDAHSMLSRIEALDTGLNKLRAAVIARLAEDD